MPRTRNSKPLTTTEREQVKVMVASGLSFNEIGRQLQKDPKTVKKVTLEPGAANEIIEMKKELADICESNARRLLDYPDQDVNALNPYQRTIAGGVMIDKMRLLRDQSTENVAVLVTALKDLQMRRQGRKLENGTS